MNSTFCRKPAALLLVVMGSFLIANQCHAQNWVRKMFQEFHHDFGTVKKGDVPEHRFVVQNVFEEDIHIAGVKSSCGCTSVSLTKQTLKTWEKGEIVCRFNSPAFDGFKRATVTVRIDRPFLGEVQLTVQGNIVRGLNFTPSSIDFGQVTDVNLPVKSIQITHFGNNPFRIVDVKSTFPHIGVQLREVSRQYNASQYLMTVRLKPTVPKGFLQGELYVVVEENGVRREEPIKFSAKVVSALQMPEMITIGPVKPGETVTKRVVLKSDRPFRIMDVTCIDNAFRVKADKEAKKVHFVELIYTAGEEAGHRECELSFYTDMSQKPTGKIKTLIEIKPTDALEETAHANPAPK